jgi:leucyl/phenylalanyl-tRNA---protein transferase
MKKPTRLRLPTLSELLLIDATIELSERVPDLELSTTAHLAGLVAVGGKFDGATMKAAYENGIFPWPHGNQIDLWFCPVWRGVIDIKEFHIPKSLHKKLKKCSYNFTLNQAFEKVIEYCSTAPRRGQNGTWIVDDLMRGYQTLRKMEVAHSLEAWKDGKLIAGIYGICAGGNFSAESMFGFESDSSKIVLVKLIEWLKSSGFKFVDIQMVTPVTKSFGGKYISRSAFLHRLIRLRKKSPKLDLSHFDS